MYVTILLEPTPGEFVDGFAEKVVCYSKVNQRNVTAVFNGTYIKVKPTTTVEEFLRQYWRERLCYL